MQYVGMYEQYSTVYYCLFRDIHPWAIVYYTMTWTHQPHHVTPTTVANVPTCIRKGLSGTLVPTVWIRLVPTTRLHRAFE